MGTIAEDLIDILPGIRVFPEPPYKIYYAPRDHAILVIRVLHSKQNHLHIRLV